MERSAVASGEGRAGRDVSAVTGRWWIRLAIGVYLLAGGALVWFGRDHINPDGVAYVQIARHYANARWDLVVTAYWSPLFSWILVPFVGNGFEPMLASKILGLPLGIAFALGAAALTREMLQADPTTKPRPSLVTSGAVLAFSSALLAALPMLPRPVTPDLLLTAILTWYFAMTLRWLREGAVRPALAAGLLGGLAYLAKAYALPFVLVHTVITGLTASPRLGTWRTFRLVAASVLLTATVAVPWITVLSLREGRPTFTAVTRFARPWHMDPSTEVGAGELFGLAAPRQGRMTMWERPEDVVIATPPAPAALAAGIANFVSRLDVNLIEALTALQRADPLGLLAAGLIVACLLLTATRPGESAPARWPIGWSLTTVALYVSGYVLVYVEPRYLWPVFGLTIAVAVTVLGRVHRAAVGWPAARLNALATLLLIGSLAYGGVRQLAEWGAADGPGAEASALRALATNVGPGPALASNRWPQGLYVAYWSSTQFIGRPDADDPDAMARQLAPFAPIRLLLFNDRDLAQRLVRGAALDLQRSMDDVWGTADLLVLKR